MFTKNRDRLLTTDMSRKVMAAILAHPEVRPLLSDEHFSVDGTLVKAWAAMKSFQPKADEAAPSDTRATLAKARRPHRRTTTIPAGRHRPMRPP